MWMWKLWPFKRRVRVPTVSDDTLHIANRLRAQRKLPRLDRFTAQNAVASNYESPGFDMLGFLVSYETGIPVNLNTESFVGAALHSSPAAADTTQGWQSDTARQREAEPMVPRYSIEDRRRDDNGPQHDLYTPSSTPVPSTTFDYTPERESYHSPSHSTPSYSSSDDNRSSSSYDSSSSYSSSDSSSSSDSGGGGGSSE